MAAPHPRRVMLKLSGELLMGDLEYGIHTEALRAYARALLAAQRTGIELVVEVGGGNIYRWRTAPKDMNRNVADLMGMFGSIMSALNMTEAIEHEGGSAQTVTSLHIPQVAHGFNTRTVEQFLKAGSIVVIGGGTGRPYFTTDTGAVLHALETKCDVVLKGTDVDGVYDRDPHRYPDAKKYDTVSYEEVLAKKLQVMDMTAFALARDNTLPIIVFNIQKPENVLKVLSGELMGTRVQSASPQARQGGPNRSELSLGGAGEKNV